MIKKKLCVMLTLLLLINILLPFLPVKEVKAYTDISVYKAKEVDDRLYISSGVPSTSANGYPFNSETWTNNLYHLIVYGCFSDVPGTATLRQSRTGMTPKKYTNYGH